MVGPSAIKVEVFEIVKHFFVFIYFIFLVNKAVIISNYLKIDKSQINPKEMRNSS